MTVSFILNGEDVSANVRSVDRLSDVLREKFGLLGVKSDCRSGRCGRCLVFLNSRLVPSCLVPAFRARGREIVTFEGFSQTDEYKDISEGFAGAGVETCGFCRNSKIMAVAALLEHEARPTADMILEQLSVAPCRCTDPQVLAKAVLLAAERRTMRRYHRAGL
ncbi:MAG: 2Fe-2S iron-sulfur cluster-binding protein [Spirochaetaceae bacterium]|nr:2Fe-2S iron-sulfur cluster-binding protein [Spirochaetaceae bacterium]